MLHKIYKCPCFHSRPRGRSLFFHFLFIILSRQGFCHIAAKSRVFYDPMLTFFFSFPVLSCPGIGRNCSPFKKKERKKNPKQTKNPHFSFNILYIFLHLYILIFLIDIFPVSVPRVDWIRKTTEEKKKKRSH